MRRDILWLRAARATVLAAAMVMAGSAAASEARHGLSVFGELKYAADFKHFDYVNPDAPKGGRLALIGSGGVTSFDNFNPFIVKGDAAQGLADLFDSLMVRAADEPDAVYGLVASSAEVADDKKSVTFKLRPEAKFADGSPVTASDIVFSFATLKEKGRPEFALSLRDVTKAEALDAETVRYEFQGELVRDLPVIVASLPVLSKTYYTAEKFEETSLKPPLGSGPYKIGNFKPGTFVTYKRRDDYWAKDLPVNRGRYNFDEVRFEYFRDRTVSLENLKSGQYDFREEFTSKDWATAYDIAAVKDGRLIRAKLPDENPSGAQGFFFNLRREQFKDPRVRRAFDLAFDFEWSNKNLFYGLYKRTTSFFENSDMMAAGPPSPEELKLLEPFRDKLPATVFGEPYSPPKTDGSGSNRDGLRQAAALLKEAGWTIKHEGGRNIAVNAKGDVLTVEVLLFEDGFNRIVGPYVENLKKIGVDAVIRMVDPAQYQQRMKTFDFDIGIERYSLRLTPGVEMQAFWSSKAAKMEGSTNVAGIDDPVIDALIDKIADAKSRAELVTATRAIDRVLRAGHYWVPQWYKAEHNIAYWNKFGRPETVPKYDTGVTDTWWYDPAKAATLAKQ